MSSKLHGLAREEERLDRLASAEFDRKQAIIDERAQEGGAERGGSGVLGTGDDVRRWGFGGRGGTPIRLPQVRELIALKERDRR